MKNKYEEMEKRQQALTRRAERAAIIWFMVAVFLAWSIGWTMRGLATYCAPLL